MSVSRLLHGVRDVLAEIVATSPRDAAGAVMWLLVLTGTEAAAALLLAPLLELIGVVEESPLPRAGGWVQAILGVFGAEPSLVSLLVLFVAVAAVRSLAQRQEALVSGRLRENLTLAFRVRLYNAIAGARWRFLVSRTPIHFANAIVHETTRVGATAGHVIDLMVAMMVALVYLALAFRLSPGTATVVLAAAALLAVLVRGSLDHARHMGAAAAQQRAVLHREIAEQVSAMKVAKSYGVTGRDAERVAALAAESRRVTLEVSQTEARLGASLELGSTVLLALIVYIASQVLGEPTALLLVMLFIFARLMPRLVGTYRILQSLSAALPVFEAMRELERECVSEAEPTGASAAAAPLTESVRFDRVSFEYLDRREPAVVEVDLTIRAGDTTAIVGASGSGKSTIADLLIGLLTPTGGRLMVDGTPLDARQLASWRAQIGYVPQDAFLFDDTVRNNIRWSRPDASDEDVWEALRLAAADAFVAALPQQLDTMVGDRGVLISGGERQRLAIARALVRRPRLLVLDEATSSLDGDHERRIQQAIDRLHHQMTIVIITHRLSTIRDADTIYVMHGGRVVRVGRWSELNLQRDLETSTP
jgi:ATP-binding cassette subfamily C protein